MTQVLLWWRGRRKAGTEASFWTSHQRQTGKSSWFQFSFVYFFFKHFWKRPLGSYEKDFLVLVGALSEEEDEWDKVSIALALTPDRGTVLHCQELFYWYFSLEKKKKTLTIPHPPIVFFLKTSLQWGLWYLIQKGTLKEGHPLMSKSCFVTLRNWFHDIEAIA